MLELIVQYDSINNICPSTHFEQYTLEQTVCSILDLNSTHCDVEDITSISTLYDHTIATTTQPSQRRLIRSVSGINGLGFEIYILMVIYAKDVTSLQLIEDHINQPDFASTIDTQWNS